MVGAFNAGPHGSNSGTSYVVFGCAPVTDVFRVGTVASQTLAGGGFDDRLFGLGGDDSLFGGGGADWFIYAARGNGTDTIADFSGQTAFGGGAGEGDKFTFDSLLHGTFEYRGSNPFLANGNTQARVEAGQVLIDTDGSGALDIVITVSGLTTPSQLDNADFQFINQIGRDR